jgi:hypothetical protein
MDYGLFPTETFLQKGWDIINTTRIIANEINLCDKIDSARFLAAQRKESNAWLHASVHLWITRFYKYV